MSSIWVLLVYGGATVLAVALLYFFHSQNWYWHVVSIVAALGLGLAPAPPEGWRGVTFDLAIGFVFLFLMVWGVGGFLAYRTHQTRHA